jgi:hypothetical protein
LPDAVGHSFARYLEVCLFTFSISSTPAPSRERIAFSRLDSLGTTPPSSSMRASRRRLDVTTPACPPAPSSMSTRKIWVAVAPMAITASTADLLIAMTSSSSSSTMILLRCSVLDSVVYHEESGKTALPQ